MKESGHLEHVLSQRLVGLLGGVAGDAIVADVRIGLGYTAVRLADGRVGLAYTFRDLAHGGCCVFDKLRPLAGRRALDLLPLLESSDAIEAGVGLACGNALVNFEDSTQTGGDVLEHLDIGGDDDVAMVGHFAPLVQRLQRRARTLTVFERVSVRTGLLRPQQEAVDVLPRCQVAIITATSIINHTVDGLIAAASRCRQVALVGASTPLFSKAFQATGATLLSGVVVTSPDEVLTVVSEGGGTRQFGPHVRKVTVKVPSTAPHAERSTK